MRFGHLIFENLKSDIIHGNIRVIHRVTVDLILKLCLLTVFDFQPSVFITFIN